MRRTLALLTLACAVTSLFAQDKPDNGPTNEKARKTYNEALDYLHRRMIPAAFDSFKKADKQDDGHCLDCQKKILHYAPQLREGKAGESAAEEMTSQAKDQKEIAVAHYDFGMLLLDEGMDRHKDDLFSRAHDEFTKAVAAVPNFPAAVFHDGRALAYLHQDEQAKAQFQHFIELKPAEGPDRQRAQLYVDQPELARALMAPPFAVTTLDGKRISLDDLQGKVVLIDFWATWCAPCREALPHVRDIAKKFDGQPLVVLSVSLDTDENKWKEFVAKNEMTWPQYFDRGFTGSVATSFNVHAIPHTFTIDADGILQDEHIGDAAMEGKLKKLVKRALEKQAAQQKPTQ
jgi:thiol-disulfide isomerase/thioredoxin